MELKIITDKKNSPRMLWALTLEGRRPGRLDTGVLSRPGVGGKGRSADPGMGVLVMGGTAGRDKERIRFANTLEWHLIKNNITWCKAVLLKHFWK